MKDHKLDSLERLRHIQKAISDIERFLKHVDEGKFIHNDLINNAVLMQFIIIGEAIVHVDESILVKFDYPWYKVKAFRNLIAHEYFNIKVSAVWQITQQDLHDLKRVVESILQKEF